MSEISNVTTFYCRNLSAPPGATLNFYELEPYDQAQKPHFYNASETVFAFLPNEGPNGIDAMVCEITLEPFQDLQAYIKTLFNLPFGAFVMHENAWVQTTSPSEIHKYATIYTCIAQNGKNLVLNNSANLAGMGTAGVYVPCDGWRRRVTLWASATAAPMFSFANTPFTVIVSPSKAIPIEMGCMPADLFDYDTSFVSDTPTIKPVGKTTNIKFKTVISENPNLTQAVPPVFLTYAARSGKVIYEVNTNMLPLHSNNI